jgi:plastocyanin
MKARSFLLVLLTISAMLAGCTGMSVRLGWHGSSSAASKSARYETFTGVERATIRAEAGQTITLTYDGEVNKGTLALALDAPDGTTLWEETFEEDAADTVTLTAPDGGRYTLRVTGDDTGGSFDISWGADD